MAAGCIDVPLKLLQNFKEWAEEFDGYSSQSNEILDTLQLFIKMTAKGKTERALLQSDSVSIQVYMCMHIMDYVFRSHTVSLYECVIHS